MVVVLLLLIARVFSVIMKYIARIYAFESTRIYLTHNNNNNTHYHFIMRLEHKNDLSSIPEIKYHNCCILIFNFFLLYPISAHE